jgi:hypothetical protein
MSKRSAYQSSERGSSETDAVTDELVHSSNDDLARINKKAEEIRTACELRDIDALVSHATSEGGFLRDELRQLACMSPRELSVIML